ncbi:MAG: hypothetical protein ACON4I_08300 [Candidatus Puniceispirillaceae bacterium]
MIFTDNAARTAPAFKQAADRLLNHAGIRRRDEEGRQALRRCAVAE